MGAFISTMSLSDAACSEVIYISPRIKSLYILQTAQKNVRVINNNFPGSLRCQIPTTKVDLKPSNKVLDPCGCPYKSPFPSLSDNLSFPTRHEYQEDLDNTRSNRYTPKIADHHLPEQLQT